MRICTTQSWPKRICLYIYQRPRESQTNLMIEIKSWKCTRVPWSENSLQTCNYCYPSTNGMVRSGRSEVSLRSHNQHKPIWSRNWCHLSDGSNQRPQLSLQNTDNFPSSSPQKVVGSQVGQVGLQKVINSEGGQTDLQKVVDSEVGQVDLRTAVDSEVGRVTWPSNCLRFWRWPDWPTKCRRFWS